MVRRTYQARIDSPSQVYDGDTIQRVAFRHPIEISDDQDVFGEVYPGLYVQKDGVWEHVNVRIAGIDAPERHPHHRHADGTQRDASDIADEHELAMKARQVVIDLLKQNGLQFELRNPQEGKYAGRIVAEVWVQDNELEHPVNVAARLIEAGLAYPYAGGTKRDWGKFHKEEEGNLGFRSQQETLGMQVEIFSLYARSATTPSTTGIGYSDAGKLTLTSDAMKIWKENQSETQGGETEWMVSVYGYLNYGSGSARASHQIFKPCKVGSDESKGYPGPTNQRGHESMRTPTAML